MKHKMAAVREVFLVGCRRLRAVIPIKEALLRGSAMNTSIQKQCLCRSNRPFHSEAVEGWQQLMCMDIDQRSILK